MVFLEGAFKGEAELNNLSKTFDGASEYRDTFYASAPNSSFVSQANSIDFDNDSFFNTGPTFVVDTSRYSCKSKSDIEVTMSRDNETLKQSLQACFDNRLNNMDFCRNNTKLQQARQNFGAACVPRP